MRLETALSLGEWKHPRAGAALGQIAVSDSDDIYLRAAVMTGAASHNAALVEAVVKGAPNEITPLYDQLLVMALTDNDRASLARLAAVLVQPHGDAFDVNQLRVFGSWLVALSRRGKSLNELAGEENDALRRVLQKSEPLFQFARECVANRDTSPDMKIAAIGLLGWHEARREEDHDRLTATLTPRTQAAIQVVAVRSLQRIADDRTPIVLLGKWRTLTPDVQSAALDVLISRTPWAMALLDRIDDGQVAIAHIDLSHQRRLTEHRDADVRLRARAAFDVAKHSDRLAVIKEYAPALQLPGDADRGRAPFAQMCAACHKVGDLGREVGPNIQSMTDQSPQGLLAAILDPNQNIEPRYIAYEVTLNDGDSLLGILASETATGINLLTPDGELHNLLRHDVETLRATELSLMPDGMETSINHQQMADLIAFLRHPARE